MIQEKKRKNRKPLFLIIGISEEMFWTAAAQTGQMIAGMQKQERKGVFL
jgi:hypothetical protein